MEVVTVFTIYLILFRLAIIAAAVVSIILGYRLFCKGVWPDAGSGKGTSVDAKIAGSGFTLKNAAPGTCFAMFGMLIIAIMFAKGGPELTLKSLEDAAQGDVKIQQLKLRGGEKSGLEAATLKGRYFEEKKDTKNAIFAYEEAVALMAEPMNQLAWLYQEQGKLEGALLLSRMATRLSQNNANYLDTLAEVLFKTGEREEAIDVMEKAAMLNPKYKNKLIRFREGVN
ncbi:MAG: tetratricopeptide repeat protein [Deltaproteobacteria bacterium]|nr:tetratricopeptide repeat protein [Deltaproteobacteria bacterium]